MKKTQHIMKALVVAAVAAGGLYLDACLLLNGEIVVAIGFLVLFALGILVYTVRRAYTYRYLFPGLVGFALFVLLPLVYTLYIAFTNYSAAHLLTLDDVKTYFMQETYLASNDRYAFEVIEVDADRVTLTLQPEGGSGQVLKTEPFVLDGAGKKVEADPVAVKNSSSDIFGMPRIVERRAALQAITVALPSGEQVRMKNLRVFAPLRRVWEPREDDSLVHRRTGAVIRPDMSAGYYVTADGEPVGPGFRVLVGLENFRKLFSDPGIREPFLRVFVWNLIFAFMSVFLTFWLGIFLAVLLDWKSLRFRRLYRTLLILPYAVPAFISILIFKGLFNPNFGEINMILDGLFGIRPQWTSVPMLAKTMILLVNTWLGYPYMMILTTGLLQSVPEELYEASSMDGSGPLSNFFGVTLPMIFPPLKPILVASFAFNFNNFLLIYLLTQGRPDMAGTSTVVGETDILVSYTFRIAFRDSAADFGFASAVAAVIFVIVAALAYANLRVSKATEEA